MGLGGPRAGAPASRPPRRGVRWFAPGTSRFGAVRSAEVGSGAVSAGGGAAGRGVGAAERVPTRPRPPALPAPGPVGRSAAPRAARSLARPSLSSSPAAGRAAPETPRGPSLGERAARPGGGLLAMSAARDTSGHFPLHLLVWNNDYRQLERELRAQVRRGGAGGGGRRGSRVVRPACASPARRPLGSPSGAGVGAGPGLSACWAPGPVLGVCPINSF